MDVWKKETVEVSADYNYLDKAKDFSDVQKNYYIARMAQCIKDIAVLHENEQDVEARYRMNYIIRTTLETYPNMEDADIKRVYDLLTKYQEILGGETEPKIANLSFPY